MSVSPTASPMEETLEAACRRLRAGGRNVLRVSDPRAPLGDSGSWDGAWISLSTTRNVDAADLGHRVSLVLRSGAPVVCSFPTCWPLHAVLERVLRGTGSWTGPSRARAEGATSPGDWRRAFGREFSWHRTRALGVLIPSRPDDAWADRHALLLGALAATEYVCGSWPLLRSLGERVLLEGVRR